MARFCNAPMDLSEYLAFPKVAPSDELEADPHVQKMDSVDPPGRASGKSSLEY